MIEFLAMGLAVGIILGVVSLFTKKGADDDL